jgi:hypothetical protein|tara:strand:+ start:806 stop:1219 length:414 start_codon:yes stop_codon:yes gene_type:complete
MTDRVLIGKKGSEYGLWVAEPGGDVLNDTDKEMLLSSAVVGTAQILMFQNIAVAANATATQNYLSNGGGKSFFNWWINADYLGGADASNYNSGIGFAGAFLTVKNKYVNATTNQIEVTNVNNSAANVLVLVVNQAAA